MRWSCRLPGARHAREEEEDNGLFPKPPAFFLKSVENKKTALENKTLGVLDCFKN
jgi:hypothetical protein